MAIFLFTVCHVVIVTLESGDVDIIFRLGGGEGEGGLLHNNFLDFCGLLRNLRPCVVRILNNKT